MSRPKGSKNRKTLERLGLLAPKEQSPSNIKFEPQRGTFLKRVIEKTDPSSKIPISVGNIECSLVPMKRFLNLLPEYKDFKFGRYISSDVKCGKGYYPVGCYINCDWETLRNFNDLTDEEILEQCIKTLNAQKEFSGKKSGSFSFMVPWYRFVPGKQIQAILSFSSPSCSLFWESAPSFDDARPRRKYTRKNKK